MTYIIDEVSMVGLNLATKTILKLKQVAEKLILFGDPSQLPPVMDKGVDWVKFADETILLTKNYRATNPKVNKQIKYFRDNGKLLKPLKWFKPKRFNKDMVVIAYHNRTLSKLQKKLLGYKTARSGDVVQTFGNSPIKNEFKRPIFINGSYVTIDKEVKNHELGKIKGIKVFSLKGFGDVTDETPYVIMGDYDKYKDRREKLYKKLQRFVRRLLDEMGYNYLPNNFETLLDEDDLEHYQELKYNYEMFTNLVYARHHQFTTTYKAQGKGFHTVVIAWRELPKTHRYVALSRAKEAIYRI